MSTRTSSRIEHNKERKRTRETEEEEEKLKTYNFKTYNFKKLKMNINSQLTTLVLALFHIIGLWGCHWTGYFSAERGIVLFFLPYFLVLLILLVAAVGDLVIWLLCVVLFICAKTIQFFIECCKSKDKPVQSNIKIHVIQDVRKLSYMCRNNIYLNRYWEIHSSSDLIEPIGIITDDILFQANKIKSVEEKNKILLGIITALKSPPDVIETFKRKSSLRNSKKEIDEIFLNEFNQGLSRYLNRAYSDAGYLEMSNLELYSIEFKRI
jgi:hypothetical protein